MVPAADVPQKWDDLLHPRWKGNKLALDRDNAVWYSGLALYWGKEKADKFMRALADQNPTMRKGHTLIATLLSSGEFPLGLVYAHRVEEMKAKGISTIEWLPLEPIVATPNVIGIGKSAPNSNAAKLFVDFFLSKEGQTISQKQQYRVPANPDLPPVSPNLDPKNLKISLVNRQAAESYEQFDKAYQELFVKGKAGMKLRTDANQSGGVAQKADSTLVCAGRRTAMVRRLFIGISQFDYICHRRRAVPERRIPAGRLSRVNPAGTTTTGTNTRNVFRCGVPL